MDSVKQLGFTYIQEPSPPSIQEQTIAHLSTTGQFPTQDPNVFEALQVHDPISATIDILELEKSIPMHSHSFMEILYYTGGNNIGFLIDDHRYVLQKGDMVIIPPGVWHCTLRSSQSTEPCVRYLMAIQREYLQRFSFNDIPMIVAGMETPYLLRIGGSSLEYVSRIFSFSVQEFRAKNLCWNEMINGCLQILLALIIRASHSEATITIKAQQDGIFEKSLAYLNQHLTEKLTLADTAQALYTSERTITREFQKNMGLSFYKYVTLRRLELSCQLIAQGIPLEEIAGRVGFSDYPTFYRAFKKQFNCSPRQMRTQSEADNM